MTQIDRAIKMFREFASVGMNNPVPTSDQIARAEAGLGHKLPRAYVRFLKECNDVSLPFWSVCWVGSDSRKRAQSEDIVVLNEQLRRETDVCLPTFLIAFHNSAGDYSCFDTRTTLKNREYAIIWWQHELDRTENLENGTILSRSFADWLIDQVQTFTEGEARPG